MWWCSKHNKYKAEHTKGDKGPCPLWFTPVGWWANLQCFMKTCAFDGTCINCNGTDEVKERYAKRNR
jgi:hypothetical protein